MEEEKMRLISPNEFWSSSIDNTCEVIEKVTIPFFFKDERERHKGHSSGILLKINERAFIVTAAHVDDDSTKIFTLIGNLEIRLLTFGKQIISRLPLSNDRDDDLIDISISEIPPRLVKILNENCRFLSLEDIAINHEVKGENEYIVGGYPASQVKKEYNSETIISKLLLFWTKEKFDISLIKKGFDRVSNIFLNYSQNKLVKTFDEKKTSNTPKPNGLSGGGIWYLPSKGSMKRYVENELLPYKLVGVIINWDYNKSILIGTRIDFITEALRIKFNLQIPVSKYVNVK